MTDRTVLRDRQYADASNLSARQSLWAHRPGGSRLAIWLDALALDGSETILDVGCGNGAYLGELCRRGHTGRLLGVDLSPGMAAEAAANARRLGRSDDAAETAANARDLSRPTDAAYVAVADATHLPVATGAIDVALAMHMLYHVPDGPAAVAELRRVVRPGGSLLAATNGAQHTMEINAVIDAAVLEVTGEPWDRPLISFTLESGEALLAPAFGRVERRDFREVVTLRSVQPIMSYIESFQPDYCGLQPGAQWSAFLAAASALVTGQVEEHGGFAVTAHSGVFRCG